MNKLPLPILFATDVGYVPHLAAALFSLLLNNNNLHIRVIIFTTALPKNDRYKLQALCGKFEVPVEFIYLKDNLFDGLILNHHFKKSNYYRLFAADLIEEEQCLYLDADIIVTHSIFELASVYLGESYLAAVENPGFNRHIDLGMHHESKYFNSGVMLINLEKWRSKNLRDKVISFVKDKTESIHFVDQCGLNGIVNGEWIELNAKYNCQTYMLSIHKFYSCRASQLPVIIHYTGSSKPWHLNNTHPYKKLYWHYRNQTPYKSFVADDFSLFNMIRYITPHFVRNFFKKIIGTKPK